MAIDLRERLSRLSVKADMLLDRYKALEAIKAQAESRVAYLTEELERKEAEIRDLKTKLEYSNIATAIAPDRDTLEAARQMIADLIRDIDRSIADLDD